MSNMEFSLKQLGALSTYVKSARFYPLCATFLKILTTRSSPEPTQLLYLFQGRVHDTHHNILF